MSEPVDNLSQSPDFSSAVEAAARALAAWLWPEARKPAAQAALTAARVPEMQAVVEAAREFRDKHERFHPDHWVAATHPTTSHRCDACDFCAALARYDEAQQCACPESWQAVGPCSGGCGKVIAEPYCQDCEITNV